MEEGDEEMAEFKDVEVIKFATPMTIKRIDSRTIMISTSSGEQTQPL